MTRVRTLPSRGVDESAADFYARVATLYEQHLDACADCNYDRECVACCADGDAGHSCNCDWAGTDDGYGHKLHKIVKSARAAVAELEARTHAEVAAQHERAISYPSHVVETHSINWPTTAAIARRVVWIVEGGRAWEIVAVTISGFVICAEHPPPPGPGVREHRAFRGDALARDVQRSWDADWDPRAW